MPHGAQGFLLQADAGSGGGKLSLGLGVRAHVEDEGFWGTAGVALRLAVARTWGNPVGTDPGLTYVGPELDLSVIRIGLTLGVLFRVSGDHGSNALFSWGLGFGLLGRLDSAVCPTAPSSLRPRRAPSPSRTTQRRRRGTPPPP